MLFYYITNESTSKGSKELIKAVEAKGKKVFIIACPNVCNKSNLYNFITEKCFSIISDRDFICFGEDCSFVALLEQFQQDELKICENFLKIEGGKCKKLIPNNSGDKVIFDRWQGFSLVNFKIIPENSI